MSKSAFIICVVIWVFFTILGMAISKSEGHKEGFNEGYQQALADIEAKRPLKFNLEKQPNGETTWVETSK